MGERTPGPLCGSRLGNEWIDTGTNCRSRSGAPGPLGILTSLVMGAAPVDLDAKKKEDEAKIMFRDGINTIAASPFAKTPEGKEIVKLLRELFKSGNIRYGQTLDGSRGDWDGTTIRVNEDYRGIAYRTIPELVHEATHALWRKKNKTAPKDEKDKWKADIDDELHARENQLIMYTHLRDKLGWPKDSLMEMRLERQKNGTLRQTIEQSFGQP